MNLTVGADEVGRGAFAGPVVAGAVVLPPDVEKAWVANPKKLPVIIRDSKKMTALQRERSARWILDNAVGYGLGIGGVKIINEKGIMPALYHAFQSAVRKATEERISEIKALKIDAIKIPGIASFPLNTQEAIMYGDSLSVHIAAASIIAKVYRDQLMTNLAQETEFEIYKWQNNKGYGTKEHCEAISQYGTCKLHRTQFVRRFSFQALS